MCVMFRVEVEIITELSQKLGLFEPIYDSSDWPAASIKHHCVGMFCYHLCLMYVSTN